MVIAAVVSGPQGSRRPLCVDLGCLLRTRLLREALWQLLKSHPLQTPGVLLRRLHGRALARRTAIDPATLSYNTELLAWLASERASGREIWLCAGSHERQAAAVAEHLGVFDGVLASAAVPERAGPARAEAPGAALWPPGLPLLRPLRGREPCLARPGRVALRERGDPGRPPELRPARAAAGAGAQDLRRRERGVSRRAVPFPRRECRAVGWARGP